MNITIETQKAYSVPFSVEISTKMSTLTDEQFAELSNKIRALFGQSDAYLHFPNMHLDSNRLHFGEYDYEVDTVSISEQAIKDCIEAIAEDCLVIIEDYLNNIDASIDPKMLICSNEAYSPQNFVGAMIGNWYCFNQEDTIKEINCLLKRHGVRTKMFEFGDLNGIVANGKKVVLVDCAGFYGGNEIVQKYAWFQVEDTPFDETQI